MLVLTVLLQQDVVCPGCVVGGWSQPGDGVWGSWGLRLPYGTGRKCTFCNVKCKAQCMFNLIIVQDYYVKRFGFLFGGGRSGMHGLQALQGHGLVQVESSTV